MAGPNSISPPKTAGSSVFNLDTAATPDNYAKACLIAAMRNDLVNDVSDILQTTGHQAVGQARGVTCIDHSAASTTSKAVKKSLTCFRKTEPFDLGKFSFSMMCCGARMTDEEVKIYGCADRVHSAPDGGRHEG
jgi:hypothetical protein